MDYRCITFLMLLPACGQLYNRYPVLADNVLEELAESTIERQTGIFIEFSPGIGEDNHGYK